MKNPATLLLVTLATTLSVMSADALSADNSVTTQYESQQISVESNTTQVLPELSVADPDTTGVWYHISQRQKELAVSEFERLKDEYPSWQPQQDLIQAISELTKPVIPSADTTPIVATPDKMDRVLSDPLSIPDSLSIRDAALAIEQAEAAEQQDPIAQAELTDQVEQALQSTPEANIEQSVKTESVVDFVKQADTDSADSTDNSPTSANQPSFTEPSQQQPSVFDQIARLDAATWPTLDNELVNRASQQAIKERDKDQLSLMGWVFNSREEFPRALSHFQLAQKIAPKTEGVEDGIIAALNGIVARAVTTKDITSLQTLSNQYPDYPLTNEIEALAWQYYEKEEYLRALKWFVYTDNPVAQVINLDKLNRKNEAQNLACQHLSVKQLNQYCIDGYAQQQLQLYEQQEYQSSLQVADSIEAIQPLSTPQLELAAWSHYQLNHIDQSKQLFTRLIKQDPNNSDFALVLVNLYGVDSQPLAQLAESYPSIADEIAKINQQAAWSRKQFDRFHWLSNTENSRTDTSIESGIDWDRQTSGDALSSKEVETYYIGFSQRINEYRFGSRVNYQSVSSETPQAGDFIGLEQLTEEYDGLHQTYETGISAYVKKQDTNQNNLAVINYWKPEDGLRHSVSGLVSSVAYLDNFTLAGSLYRERVEDSFLSYSGMFDQSSTRWGSVHANGVKGVVAYSFTPSWSISSELDTAYLAGENVEDNSKLAAELSLTRNFAEYYTDQLDYLRVGPVIRWISYDENQNDYTQGNGGYFSPERFLTLAGKVALLTPENRRWQVKGEVELAHSSSDPGSVTRYRYSDNATTIAQDSSSGVSATIEIEGQWLIHPHWQLATYIKQNISDSYHEAQVGLQIRWNLNAKQGVTSDTLISSSPYNADYAWY